MNNNLQSILDSSSFQVSTQLNLFEGLIILILALTAGLYIRFLYTRFAITFSSKTSYGNSFLFITISVASLIAVVKSSLALSLGLVGALSVIRYRTAIKDPFNLAIMLFSISLGISIGASQFQFAILIAILGLIAILYSYKTSRKNIQLKSTLELDDIDTVSMVLPYGSSLSEVYRIVSENTLYYSLLSLEQEDKKDITLVMNVKFSEEISHENLKNNIFELFPDSLFTLYGSTQS